ncbi:hypothetical protein B0J11DRAFT_584460 [Dendryphion nanum]|uniref:JmjC domain-containing histone demethylation protein 1 n=1 Tax=Dendryphion nanum TaxID=256645 RepID=A0A9P9D7J6_9PLEO|nr:hypothetical protein B0J11DRAFT_584460 [Dendryphion nanum]
MRLSSFKPHCRQTPQRAATPPRPAYEPLSPILSPSEPSLVNPAGGKHKLTGLHGNGAGGDSTHNLTVRGEVGHPHLQLSSPPGPNHNPPPPSAPLPLPHSQYSPAHGSPIETLANAAVSHVRPGSSYATVPHHRPYAVVQPPAAAVNPHYPLTGHAFQPPYTDYTYEERPSKRARSEFLPSPQNDRTGQQHSRPATSHIPQWSYNVEHMVDNGLRMYHDNHAASSATDDNNSKRLSDAQLLLDFAVSVSHSTLPRTETSRRWSVSHQQQVYVFPPMENAEAARPRLGTAYSEAMLPEQQQQHHPHYPAPLPFPLPTDRVSMPVPDQFLVVAAEPTPVAPAIQTRTPPEESLSASTLHAEDDGDNNEGKRPKKHQGWPKGKPRGPRNSVGTSKRKKMISKPKTTTLTAVPSGATTSTIPGPLHSPQSLPAEHHDARSSANAVPAPAPAFEPSSQDLDLRTRRHSFSFSNASMPSVPTCHENPTSHLHRAQSVPLGTSVDIILPTNHTTRSGEQHHEEEEMGQTTICGGCNSSDSHTMIGDGEQWISCDGCKGWFHFVCAGFKSEREVREIDKFYCDGCQPKFGNTTKVRKSGRSHRTVDYAGLNEGIMKTSDDNPEHHYIQAFKNGDLTFTPEGFARLPPECVTADFIEKMNAFTEPIVIPAALNPRPRRLPTDDATFGKDQPIEPDEEQYGFDMVPDDGQDKIDMVIPEGLTVRRVSELYGPHETVPVIDVKAQEGEDKRWTMAKWADYYEQQGEKPVRNVISLEVSRSKLGRLIRRPKVVRDMDLQDSIWPDDDHVHAPPVQFYCLMSVADCYTDFHIDFGGSSVYYHIVKGRKTFFFIPPTKQNLKKYEDWCLSPTQSHEFLGLQVKECYRVDLFPGDTMLIPSGWIHAVWTPADSLVIGGNYLTRIHYGMQIKVVEIEKNTKVAPKFRYPFFQKIMWLSLLRYLEEDPTPAEIEELLLAGGQFSRTVPVYCEPNKFGHNSHEGRENYNRRYYPKAELDGLPDLLNYIWRTVMISLGKIEGISQQVRNAVIRSIPKGHGEPLVLARRFAIWVSWKRGNEVIPQWAHLDASLPEGQDSKGERKVSAAQAKRMERESLREVLKASTPRNVRTRGSETSPPSNTDVPNRNLPATPGTSVLPLTGFLRPSREHITTPKTSQLGPKRIACDACRKRRIRCKHKDVVTQHAPANGVSPGTSSSLTTPSSTMTASLAVLAKRRESDVDIATGPLSNSSGSGDGSVILNGGPVSTDLNADAFTNKSGRVKACADCRKSKRRCIHDENGNIDPIKASETPVPRGSASKKRRVSENDEGELLNKKIKRESFAGIISGEVSHYNRYPLARPAPASSPQEDIAVHSAQQALDLTAHEDSAPVDSEILESLNGRHGSETPSYAQHRESVVSSIEHHPGESMEGVEGSDRIDPQLLGFDPQTPAMRSFHAPNRISPKLTHSVSPCQRQNSSTVTPASPSMARPIPINLTPRKKSQTPRGSGRTSSTPESGVGRRDSKGNIKLEAKSEPRSRAMPLNDTHDPDEASLALALQLQKEEHGLRRRSR